MISRLWKWVRRQWRHYWPWRHRLLDGNGEPTLQALRLYRESFEGTVYEEDLSGRTVAYCSTPQYTYYRCPCGGTDHAASRNTTPFGPERWVSPILHCREHNLQWMILPGGGRDNIDYVSTTIRGEEARYFKLLKRAPATIKKFFSTRPITGKNIAVLWHTYGIDIDTILSVLKQDRNKSLRASAEAAKQEHRKTGGRKS